MPESIQGAHNFPFYRGIRFKSQAEKLLRHTLVHIAHGYVSQDGGADPRLCPACGGRLGLKLASTGGFIGCSGYPACRYARPMSPTPDGAADMSSDPGGEPLTSSDFH